MDLKTKMMISIIVPCLNEESTSSFYQSVEALLLDLGAEVEYVFVDDGSSDGTLELLKAYRVQNSAVHYISFSRIWEESKLCMQACSMQLETWWS